MQSLDVFAETNPAFCSLVLFKFCEGYSSEAAEGVDFPLILLPLPIVLSGNLEESFKHTRMDTGFFAWIDRNPGILIDLSERIQGTIEVTRKALEFGISRSVLQIDNTGRIKPDTNGLAQKKLPASTSKVGRAYVNSLRFGQWLGQINSASTIYNHLGLEI